MTFGKPLVDEEVADPVFGRPRHVFTFESAGAVRRNEHLGLSKAQSAEALHDRAPQRAQPAATSIVKPVLHEGAAVQQLEENVSQFPITTTVVPAFSSDPHPHHVVRI